MRGYDIYSDPELITLLKEDDHVAFTEIYKRYWKKMLLIAWNHCRDKDTSKDIVHEVFICLWERRNAVEILNLAAFLATSVKFSIFKYYQKESRRTTLLGQNYQFDELSHDEDKLDALFLKEYIDGIVEEMPEKCRLVFRHSRDMGMKNAEIADKFQITEKGVEATLTRALKIIRTELKNNTRILLLPAYILYSLFK